MYWTNTLLLWENIFPLWMLPCENWSVFTGSLPSDSWHTPQHIHVFEWVRRVSQKVAAPSVCLCLTQWVALPLIKVWCIVPACPDPQRCHKSPWTTSNWNISVHQPLTPGPYPCSLMSLQAGPLPSLPTLTGPLVLSSSHPYLITMLFFSFFQGLCPFPRF